jgi:hypothetical protein
VGEGFWRVGDAWPGLKIKKADNKAIDFAYWQDEVDMAERSFKEEVKGSRIGRLVVQHPLPKEAMHGRAFIQGRG